ncbi:class I SAM-dependent methyltransferase [uncultured Cellulomonas sp.]|uniref:class I SAM-dependent methyltransferase n=1 Tax=uncultured Cellulomonas sp. TaxID=189682 RepID=UPI00261BB932|nr:class I SAM-dependent methyltransferase [uncultured Cellulomonas sp.]
MRTGPVRLSRRARAGRRPPDDGRRPLDDGRRLAGTLRRLAWRACYEALGARVREPAWAFMNYGYADVGPGADGSAPGTVAAASDPLVLDPADEPDRSCIRLYAATVAGVDLRGADVLEVGSGRGGGASWLSRYAGPRSTTGLDFSAAAVALATRHRRGPGLRFVRGDALALPFPDASFDAVVSVESSHCYPSVPRFLAEVRRVLRPGGHLLLADLRNHDDVVVLRDQLAGSGLELVELEDVTVHVVAALRQDNARKLALIEAWIPRPVHGAFRVFAGIEGTRNHVGLERGDLRYLRVRLTKPQVSAG